ncbi:MAG: RNA polymerase sigma factor [Anaerolineae bacterium]|nr:RNA polymerase sigma factor [Anaerolineae bacterium]
MPDEDELVRRCQQGDLRAFADLVEQYQDRLFDLAWTILQEREAAKDAVQETFLTVFQKIEGFRGEAALETWLVAITVNQCRSRLRRQKARRLLSMEGLSSRLFRAGKQGADPAAIVDQQMQRQALWQLVNRLDDRLRLPILLYYRYGLSGDEIAAALGVTKGTVYERLSQGRQRLRQMQQMAEAGLPDLWRRESC